MFVEDVLLLVFRHFISFYPSSIGVVVNLVFMSTRVCVCVCVGVVCVGVWVCECVDVVCGCACLRVCGCAGVLGVWVCGCVGVCVCVFELIYLVISW